MEVETREEEISKRLATPLLYVEMETSSGLPNTVTVASNATHFYISNNTNLNIKLILKIT